MPDSKQIRPLRVAVLASGRGSNFEALVKTAQSHPAELSVVQLISDRPSSRALELAIKYGIQASCVPREKTTQSEATFYQKILHIIEQSAADLVVLAGFMRIVPANFVSALDGRLINIHPSLLPKFKGLNAQQQALDAGEKESGCTVHFVSTEVDSGEIIAQRTVPIESNESVESLSKRILEQEHVLLAETVLKFARGELRLPV